MTSIKKIRVVKIVRKLVKIFDGERECDICKDCDLDNDFNFFVRTDWKSICCFCVNEKGEIGKHIDLKSKIFND